jgi:hypothetical protein
VAFSVRCDVEGVEGLHIACNVLSEDFERCLFQGEYLYAPTSRQRMPDRAGACASLMIESFTREVWEVSGHSASRGGLDGGPVGPQPFQIEQRPAPTP